MSTSEFKREEKTSIPVVAICYDFDKTLSPDDMQAQGYIQSVGFDVGDFWKKSNGLARGNDKKKVYKMMHDKRIKYFAAADYSEGRELDTLVKAIIDRTAYNEKLETMHYKNLNEAAASEEK